jgi:hypothetical protein
MSVHPPIQLSLNLKTGAHDHNDDIELALPNSNTSNVTTNTLPTFCGIPLKYLS